MTDLIEKSDPHGSTPDYHSFHYPHTAVTTSSTGDGPNMAGTFYRSPPPLHRQLSSSLSPMIFNLPPASMDRISAGYGAPLASSQIEGGGGGGPADNVSRGSSSSPSTGPYGGMDSPFSQLSAVSPLATILKAERVYHPGTANLRDSTVLPLSKNKTDSSSNDSSSRWGHASLLSSSAAVQSPPEAIFGSEASFKRSSSLRLGSRASSHSTQYTTGFALPKSFNLQQPKPPQRQQQQQSQHSREPSFEERDTLPRASVAPSSAASPDGSMSLVVPFKASVARGLLSPPCTHGQQPEGVETGEEGLRPVSIER